MKSKINVNEIIEKHFSTLKGPKGNFLKKDKKYFFKLPIFIGVILIFIVNIPTEKLIDFFTLSLSVFIGLFLNLLILIISFSEKKEESIDEEKKAECSDEVKKKLKTSKQKNKEELLKHTFYNITYTIVASLIGLGILFIANVSIFPVSWEVDFSFMNNKYFNYSTISANVMFQWLFYFVFYIFFAHIIITLLMIIKRIFKLFDVEIEKGVKD